MSASPNIVITTERDQHHDCAAALAQKLNAPFVPSTDAADADLRLVFIDSRLELCARGMKTGTGIAVDFTTVDLRSISKKHPLARAVGRETKTVIDATAGMGQDAFLLASLGYDVTAVERSPIIAALLIDGLHRATEDERLRSVIDDRLRFVCADACDVIRSLKKLPDAIYIDPMFPPKRRESALPRKEIQIIRKLVGDDPDAVELFQAAITSGVNRIVIKRPHHAPPLAGEPDATIESKLVRYDLYFPTPLAA